MSRILQPADRLQTPNLKVACGGTVHTCTRTVKDQKDQKDAKVSTGFFPQCYRGFQALRGTRRNGFKQRDGL
jgi:hypothetical protein